MCILYVKFVHYKVCLCWYIVSKPSKKEMIDVGCKLKVRDRGVIYAAKV